MVQQQLTNSDAAPKSYYLDSLLVSYLCNQSAWVISNMYIQASDGNKLIISSGTEIDTTCTPTGRNCDIIYYTNADKPLARPGRKQATATEYFEFHISYL